MARTTVQEFKDDYLVVDGMLGNAFNLNKAPEQLKEEIEYNATILDEHQILLDVLQGKNPLEWVSNYQGVGYSIDDYVFWNDSVWKSTANNNLEEPGTEDLGGLWEFVELTAAGGGAGAGDIFQEVFISTAGQTEFEIGVKIENVLVFIDGILVKEADYQILDFSVLFNYPLREFAEVHIVYNTGVPFDTSYIKTAQEFIAEDGQIVLNVKYNINNVDVFVDGIMLTRDMYSAPDGETIFFTNQLSEDEVIIVNSFGVVNFADIYTKDEVDKKFIDLYEIYAVKSETLSKSNTDPYSPSSVYHPATKGYVDAMASSAGGNVEITKGYEFSGGSGESTFDCGSDDAYIPGSVDVYINGLQLNSTDYTAADGRNFTLNYVPELNDIIKLVAYGGADVYNKSQTDLLIENFASKTESNNFLQECEFIETKDTVYNLSGTVIDPANGMIQQIVVSTATSFTENIDNGQVVLLNILNGSSSLLTWPQITWSTPGGLPPILNTVDTVVIYKVNDVLYGTHSGNA